MSDLISRKALMDEYFRKCNRECCICVERDDESGECGLVRYAPAVDAEPVRHGRWIENEDTDVYDGFWNCSECGHKIYSDLALMEELQEQGYALYCEHCGAKMDGDWKEF